MNSARGGEIQEAIDFFEYIAGEGRRLLGETTPSETFSYRKKGLGVEIL
jgi:acyl-CoA reductase-like NAD-dependent aldehyde dehydrogenase